MEYRGENMHPLDLYSFGTSGKKKPFKEKICFLVSIYEKLKGSRGERKAVCKRWPFFVDQKKTNDTYIVIGAKREEEESTPSSILLSFNGLDGVWHVSTTSFLKWRKEIRGMRARGN